MQTDSTRPIVVEKLVRKFGDITAVDGIDLTVDAGEMFGFLGPNGAGKTTTVRMLATLLRPTGGRATVAGYDVVKQAAAVRRSIGIALQEAAIDPLMSGRELLRLQAVLHGIPKVEARPREERLLETVGLTAAADRRVATYSGGMKRRLDLALALMHEPIVMFLDEPTTGLDPNSRVALWEEVRKLNRDGTTVFLTTQYMEEADQLAGRVAIIDEGRIVAQGSPAQLKREIGDPTLRVALPTGQDPSGANEVLRSFGEVVAESPDHAAVRLPGGAASVAAVAVALDAAGVTTVGLELHAPSLDDVFQKATGHRLEGDLGKKSEGADDPPKTRRSRRGAPR